MIEALRSLEVRAVVTCGPAIELASLPQPPNVHLCASAPHNRLLPEASVVVTHAGHGTVIRSLAAGVPLLCMPMGRDQNDNAARVVARGAGLRLSPRAESKAIRRAVQVLLQDTRYRTQARGMGRQIAEDARNSQAVRVLEEASRDSEPELARSA